MTISFPPSVPIDRERYYTLLSLTLSLLSLLSSRANRVAVDKISVSFCSSPDTRYNGSPISRYQVQRFSNLHIPGTPVLQSPYTR